MGIRNRINRYRLSYQAARKGIDLVIKGRLTIVHPVLLQGKGAVVLEDGVTLGYWLAGSPTLPIILQPRYRESRIIVGRDTSIVNGTEIVACSQVEIGRNCRIGAKITVMDSDFHGIKPHQRHLSGKSAPIHIKDNVWLGNGVTILKGVVIGNDSVVGTQAVITKNLPNGAIAVGNPARIIGTVYD